MANRTVGFNIAIAGILIAFLIGLASPLMYYQSEIFGPADDEVCEEPDDELKDVKLAWLAPLSLEVPLIASEMQFDEEFGINLELVRMTRASDAVQALLTGDVDVAFSSFLTVESSYLQGSRIKGIINAYYGGYKLAIVTLNSTGITEVSDLAGKTVAVPGLGAPPEILVRMAAQASGISPDSVNLIQQPLDVIPTSVATGEVDAGVLFEPGVTSFLFREPGAVVLTRGIDLPVINYAPTAYFVLEDTIKDDNEMVYNIFLSLAKAQWYIRDTGPNSEEILSIMSNGTGIPVPVLTPSSDTNIWDPRSKPVLSANLREEMQFAMDAGNIESLVPFPEVWHNGFYERALIEHPEFFNDLDSYLQELQDAGLVKAEDFIIDSNEYWATKQS
jgi:ABC-type nitrate/sulfonate/bicarbonate transport system substrate-binding protein